MVLYSWSVRGLILGIVEFGCLDNVIRIVFILFSFVGFNLILVIGKFLLFRG